ncbi:hypothetical protein QBC39DRAFT_364506 [Podospora conica]|nr:hypothetical protein QBC39DRAFT_364506 [Schizothecium conicum]
MLARSCDDWGAIRALPPAAQQQNARIRRRYSGIPLVSGAEAWASCSSWSSPTTLSAPITRPSPTSRIPPQQACAAQRLPLGLPWAQGSRLPAELGSSAAAWHARVGLLGGAWVGCSRLGNRVSLLGRAWGDCSSLGNVSLFGGAWVGCIRPGNVSLLGGRWLVFIFCVHGILNENGRLWGRETDRHASWHGQMNSSSFDTAIPRVGGRRAGSGGASGVWRLCGGSAAADGRVHATKPLLRWGWFQVMMSSTWCVPGAAAEGR